MAVTKFLARDVTASIMLSANPSVPTLTGVAATGVFTATAHGLVAGQPIIFTSLTGPTAGLSANTIYWVIAAGLAANTFEVSSTFGGSVLLWTTNVSAGAAQGTFTTVGGLATLTHAPKTTESPTTTFTSAGHAEHIVGERTEEWTLSGLQLEDVSAGTQDAGQSGCKTLSHQVGLSSIGFFQIKSPGGNAITFYATAEVTLHSGGNNEAATWQCKLSVSGNPTYTP